MANLNIRRKSGYIVRGGVARRETLWLAIQTVETALTGAPTAVLTNFLSAEGLALRPFTIVRTRGMLFVQSDQASAAETFIGDFGISVVSEQALAIGITAVPTPLTDKGSDLFFVYEQLASRFHVGGGSGTGVPTKVGNFKEYDSKAMRKVNDDQDIAVTVENEINGLSIFHSGRMLIKLH